MRHGGLAFLAAPPQRVVLRSAGAASLFVAYSDVPVGTEQTCERATALVVDPPRVVVRVRLDAVCGHGLLRESPFLVGARRLP